MTRAGADLEVRREGVDSPSMAEMVERSGSLKGALLEYSRHPRFAKALRQATKEFSDRGILAETDAVDLLDSFVIGYRLPDGQTLLDHFVAARRDLRPWEKDMLLGWRDAVQGPFEVQRDDGDAILMVNLVDDLAYRARSNLGPAILARMRPGWFVVTRLVPVGGDWVFSGNSRVLPPSDRASVARLAANLSLKCPGLVFRNTAKLEKAWELQRWERARFIEFFGTDLVILSRDERKARLHAYWEHRNRVVAEGQPSSRWPWQRSRPPSPSSGGPWGSDDLPDADTVGVIFDEMEGMNFYLELGQVAEVFLQPALVTEPANRKLIRGYLEDESVSPLALRRLAERDPARASRLFQLLLKRPSFSWPAEGEALLRRYKAAFYTRPVLPSIVPAQGMALEHYGSTSRR